MTLRSALLAVSAATVIGGLAALAAGWHAWTFIIWSAIVLLAIVFERWRYGTPVKPMNRDETRTGERFLDPETGVLMEVIYDGKTGERRYAEVSGNAENP